MTNKTNDFELFTPTASENKYLDSLDPVYIKVSEMSVQERQFLSGLIRRNKPKKLLELGVSAGGSSVIMLNAIKDIPGASLHSVEYSKEYYLDKTKSSGFIVNEYKELDAKWHLYAGGLALKYMDKIGSGIDFCFIDTMHTNPGELLDTLMVLPYLTDDAIIVYHDINLHTWHIKKKIDYDIRGSFTNNLMMSALPGKKYLLGDFSWSDEERTHFPNIGAVKISQVSPFAIVNLLTLIWGYLPSENEQKDMIKFASKHYDAYIVDYLKAVFEFQRKIPASEKLILLWSLTTKSLIKKVLPPSAVNAAKKAKNAARRERLPD